MIPMDIPTVIDYAFWGLLSGLLVGIIPVVVGALKDSPGLGIAGFFACAISGAVLGLLLAVPVCGLFVWAIVRKTPGTNGIEIGAMLNVPQPTASRIGYRTYQAIWPYSATASLNPALVRLGRRFTGSLAETGPCAVHLPLVSMLSSQ